MMAARERLAGVHLVTRRLAEGGMPEVEMVRGDGYHYFNYAREENGVTVEFHTYSVMIPHFRSYTVAEWEEIGRTFGRECRDGKYDDAAGRLQ